MKSMRLTEPEPSSLPGGMLTDVLPVERTYSDAHIPAAEALRAELKDSITRLVLAQRTWDGLLLHQTPESHSQRDGLAQRILELKNLTQKLAVQIAETEDTIHETEALYAAYVQRAAASAPTVETLDAALKVLHAHLDWAATESAYFDRTAADLLARTGDRHAFRRPRLDPRRTVRDGVEELLKKLERQRMRKLGRVVDVAMVRGESA